MGRALYPLNVRGRKIWNAGASLITVTNVDGAFAVYQILPKSFMSTDIYPLTHNTYEEGRVTQFSSILQAGTWMIREVKRALTKVTQLETCEVEFEPTQLNS